MTSHPDFDAKTTATEVAAAFADSIKGKNVIVTGISPASIGYTTALAIASKGPANLILASRTQSKLDAVVADIKAAHPSVTVHVVLLDLASVDSIRAAAAAVGQLVDHVDVLINNAGISASERHPLTTPDGTTLDSQFFTNHLGVFLLTSLLLPLLKASSSMSSSTSSTSPASPARIVNLSSQGHRLSPVRFSDYAFLRGMYDVPDDEKPAEGLGAFFTRTIDGYPGFVAYGQSKTANILHATELARRLAPANIRAFSVHPGTIETELSRSLDQEGRDTINTTAPHGLWKTQDQGAATTLVAAFDPKLDSVQAGGSGEGATAGYLSDCQLRDDMLGVHATGTERAKRLWEESERMLMVSVSC